MKRLIMFITLFLFITAGSSCYSMENPAAAVPVDGGMAAWTQVNGEEVQVMREPVEKAPIVAGHNCIMLDRIPPEWINNARADLHIAYGHTSHGSQITSGLLGLTAFKGEPLIYKKGAPKGSLDLRDNPFGGEKDLGNPDNKTWADETRKYLKKNRDINVVIWSWCGQLSTGDKAFVQNYLDLMQSLEEEFPNVTFVYMTGHLDGTGEEGALAANNNIIREFCRENNKVLYDFADIESYNPDGEYFADKYANAACWYDSNGDKQQEKNWAQDWQNSHTKGVDWYVCDSAHSEPLNANMKAYAFWWLMARLEGWSGETAYDGISGAKSFDYYAEKLQALDLFKGTGSGFDLGRAPTRLEGAVMLTRLLGGEEEARSMAYRHPFKDARKSWGDYYIGYLYHYNLVKGISDNKYGCDMKLDAASYVTFLLRTLGYSDDPAGGDFTWESALESARDFGIIDGDYYAALHKGVFDRGNMAKLTYLSLNQKLKGSDMTLLEKLTAENSADGDVAEPL